MLTAAEAAAKLRVSPATIYSLCRAGEIAHYRFGRAVRIEDADLDAYVARQKAIVTTPEPTFKRPNGLKEGGFARLRAGGWVPPGKFQVN